jgi:hypothetical protein
MAADGLLPLQKVQQQRSSRGSSDRCSGMGHRPTSCGTHAVANRGRLTDTYVSVAPALRAAGRPWSHSTRLFSYWPVLCVDAGTSYSITFANRRPVGDDLSGDAVVLAGVAHWPRSRMHSMRHPQGMQCYELLRIMREGTLARGLRCRDAAIALARFRVGRTGDLTAEDRMLRWWTASGSSCDSANRPQTGRLAAHVLRGSLPGHGRSWRRVLEACVCAATGRCGLAGQRQHSSAASRAQPTARVGFHGEVQSPDLLEP